MVRQQMNDELEDPAGSPFKTSVGIGEVPAEIATQRHQILQASCYKSLLKGDPSASAGNRIHVMEPMSRN
jgi:hypothetical protein